MGKVAKRNSKPKKKTVVKEMNNLPKSRKNIRKEKRNIKKIHRKEYYEKNKRKSFGQFVRYPQDNDDSSEENVIDDKKDDKKNNLQNNRLMKDTIADKRKEKKLKLSMAEQRKSQLLAANEEEDKIIKKLEKQLKFKKSKSGALPKSFASDGLDYLLEVCDPKTMAAAILTEKHLADNESGSDFEEDFAIATGQKNKIKQSKEEKNKNCKLADDDFESEDDEQDNSDVDNFDVNESCESEREETTLKNDVNSDLSDKSDVDNFDDMMEKSLSEDSSDEEILESTKKSKSKQKSNKKCINHKLDTDSEDDIDDDSMHNGELSEEELEMLYTGASSFPDGVYRPENLTPIREETESDLDLYKKGLETISNKNECINESSIDDDSSESCMGEFSESSMLLGSDDSECEPGCMSSGNESECENEQIIINGKVINTYGREIAPKIDEDIVRCPQLDNILANISDSEPEINKSHHVNVTSKTTIKKDSSNCKKSEKKIERKRKKIENLEVQTSAAKKVRKSSDEMFFEESATEKKSDKSNTSENNWESDSDMSDEGSSQNLSDSDDNPNVEELKKDDTWEDIYGRKRDKVGNVLDGQNTKYVPPHLRKLENNDESQETMQLKRQIKSLLNKVAGSNMHWISSQIESVYNSHSRHSVNSCFCSLWMSAIIQPVTVSDRLVIEHSVLVAVLHANVGSEIGAFFLQTIINKYDELFKSKQNLENKELDNLILGISQLYNFKIFHASLLYEILNKFLDNLTEKSIDCILVVLRNVGGVLRKEDPSALKMFIQNAQDKSTSLKNSTSGSRVNFMLEILLAIKNNNLNKIPNYDPSYSEEMKKAMKGILRRGNTVVPLNIKLEDLLNSDKRGRWWIVGSAWEHNSNIEKPKIDKKEKTLEQSHLLKLADKQRINTDLRRNIFCIIMSAEDYIDAFEKLQHLGLKQQQEREIINILIVCCLQEKEYNPYYSVLAQRFCDYDRKFQMSIQYNVWDKLKDLNSCSMFQISNLAQFLTYLFIEKGLPISILKVVEFAELSKPTLRLMRQILLGLLLHKETQKTLEVFQRVAVSPKLHLFRESLRLFISHFLVKTSKINEDALNDKQKSLLKERASMVDRILQSDSKLKF